MALETLASTIAKWLWDKYGKEIGDHALDELKKKWEGGNIARR